ncbi:hypothetical protein PR048_004706 [Dryococelus australis]|uniref:Uncharacterized protein n=1 Tax=Dryococelus australis TaxID=614101 RepID=A0ABQ9I646_9NEOP|nr:hypothetical protein PR048_004706 [Dryococelus australis]
MSSPPNMFPYGLCGYTAPLPVRKFSVYQLCPARTCHAEVGMACSAWKGNFMAATKIKKGEYKQYFNKKIYEETSWICGSPVRNAQNTYRKCT